MDKLFWGRLPLTSTYAHLFFEKDKTSQHVLFQLKYQHNRKIGELFGREIGERLGGHDFFHAVEVLIPVPLHPKKAFFRGYNQSEVLAKGIAATSGVPVNVDLVKRIRYADSQTRKSRFVRWDNVRNTFQVDDSIVRFKHVALVDDVITTGSTIESICVELRAKHPTLSISVITLGIA